MSETPVTKTLPPDVEAIDIGSNRYVSFLTNSDGEKVGIVEWHDCRGNLTSQFLSAGMVIFDTPEARAYRTDGPYWELRSLEPLHLEPSIACKVCDNHGFIRNGQWEDA